MGSEIERANEEAIGGGELKTFNIDDTDDDDDVGMINHVVFVLEP